jgi:glycosyltransferase involved in cell wall biosynthesis
MKIALVAPPFIAVPPRRYGGTELFVAELATHLQKAGVGVVVYANGASTVPVEMRWIFPDEDWPIADSVDASLKGLAHTSWAVKDASAEADVIHLNSAPGVSFSRFVSTPMVYTVHHAFEQPATEYYKIFPDVFYVTISDFQRFSLPLPRIRTIHHGIDFGPYQLQESKQDYMAFLGRIAPQKGTHLAVEIAKKSNIPLKIAGEIQPIFKDYWEATVQPHIDGKFIEYVGEVGGEEKNRLLGNARAMLFPIQWDEPFGLVLIESMACGTPVLAMPGGSVSEIVKEGVSGHVRNTVDELAHCAKNLQFDPKQVRSYVEKGFSAKRMVEDYMQLYQDVISGPETRNHAERSVA